MKKRLTVLLAVFLLCGGVAFSDWDDGITQPWNYPLVAQPITYATYFSVTYPGSTPSVTNVSLACSSVGVPACLAVQDVADYDYNYSIAATIDFDDNAANLAEIGLSACVTGGVSATGYTLGLNPNNDGYLALVEFAGASFEEQTNFQIPNFDADLTYNMKLVVEEISPGTLQIDGYLYDMAGVELKHLSMTDSSPKTGTTAGTFTWNTAGDINTVAPQGYWADARISAIPEPGTIALLCSGLLALVGFAYHRRR